MKKHLNIRIFGAVQGVGYRFFAKRTADKTGLTGFVKNEFDGTVYVEAEGEIRQIQNFIIKLREGPWHGEVSKLEVSDGEISRFQDFRIIF